jgi:predicted Rossmann fold nucleotide-binding protein DprA/Smf involved in DNA uptake
VSISTRTQATMLITSYLSKPSKSESKPLTATEWTFFAKWLFENKFTPEDLILNNPRDILKEFSDQKITRDRLLDLLSRGGQLALVTEKWSRAGIWVISRTELEYPKKLKQHLQELAPPIIYGCGNKALLNKGGVAVVGSRNADEKLLGIARKIGYEAAMSGYSVVSGGARGVDGEAMRGSFDAKGTTVGVLSDNLLRSALSPEYRNELKSNDFVLISIYYPEAGFSVGSAMGRNKYIYCLSDTSIVVSSAKNSGGTWSGAVENLKNRWVPLWVYDDKNSEGNQALIRLSGNNAFVEDGVDFSKFVKTEIEEKKSNLDQYQEFVNRLKMDLQKPLIKEEIKKIFAAIRPKELDAWLKKAIEERIIEKKGRPIMYTPCREMHSNNLFGVLEVN